MKEEELLSVLASAESTRVKELMKEVDRNSKEIGIRKLALALGQYMVVTQKTELSSIELMRITEQVIKEI